MATKIVKDSKSGETNKRPKTYKTIRATVGFEGLAIEPLEVQVQVAQRASFDKVRDTLIEQAFVMLGAQATLSNIETVPTVLMAEPNKLARLDEDQVA